MDFIDEIKALAAKIPQVKDQLQTEEATKIALIVPFIYRVLGYDVADPREFVPELCADWGTAKASKVDYGICIGGEPVILFECKWSGQDLQKKDENQLRDYFQACKSSRLGVVTNGIKYRFFTDLDDKNRMDERPFLEFDMSNPKEALVPELKKLTKSEFDPAMFTEFARALKYTKAIKTLIAEEFALPTDDFVKFFARKVYPAGKQITATVLEQFKGLTQQAINQHLDDRMQEIWRRGKDSTSQKPSEELLEPHIDAPKPESITDEEREAYQIVRAILCQVVSPKDIHPRKSKSRLDILFKDSNRTPLCRLYFDHEPKEAGLLDGNKAETRQPIQELSDIYNFSEQLKAIASHYLNKTVANGNHVEQPETPGE